MNIPMIPVLVGTTLVYAPDYSVPGVREAVEAEHEAAAEWPSSGAGMTYTMWRRNRRAEQRG